MITQKWMMALAMGLLVARADAQDPAVFTNKAEKMSYVIGVDMARDFKRQGLECDPDFVAKGLRDALSGGRLALSEGDFRQTLLDIQNDVRMRQALVRGKSQAEIQKKRGEAFLADNGSKTNVVTLPSGLQYRILKTGNGNKPTDTDTVECNYRGTLLDGTEFYSSKPGQPSPLKLSDCIAGLKEALKLMPVGSQWELCIPAGLAYGVMGVGKDIGPNEVVIYNLELVAIK